MSGQPPAAGLHLVELGVRWPPETFIAERVERLAAGGMRITVATESPPGAEDPAPEGVEPLRLPHPEMNRGVLALRALVWGIALGLRRPRRLWRVTRAALRPPAPCSVPSGQRLLRFAAWARLARMQPDVAHCEWNGSVVKFLPVLDLWAAPLVASSHGSDVALYPHTTRAPRARAGLQAAFERAARYHFVCRDLMDRAVALGLDPDRAVVIPNAVDPGRFSPGSEAPGEDRSADATPALVAGGAVERELSVICVGWLRWMKGHEYAVRAVAELANRGVPVRLDVVGSDPDGRVGEPGQSARIAYVARECGVADRVRLLGKRSRREVSALLKRSDVLLQASVSEGMPVSILEAMATGLPVVVTACGGVAETVTDGVSGLVVPPRDPGAIADALEQVWRDPARARDLGTAARRRVASDFAIAEQTSRFEGLYAELTGKPS